MAKSRQQLDAIVDAYFNTNGIGAINAEDARIVVKELIYNLYNINDDQLNNNISVPIWNAVLPYNLNFIVEYDNKFWKSLQTDNLNHQPAENEFWTEVSKNTAGQNIDLSNYYLKQELETPGQSKVALENIEPQPSSSTITETSQAVVESPINSESDKYVSGRRWWQAFAAALTYSWTWTLKQIFTVAPRFSSMTASRLVRVDANKDVADVTVRNGIGLDSSGNLELGGLLTKFTEINGNFAFNRGNNTRLASIAEFVAGNWAADSSGGELTLSRDSFKFFKVSLGEIRLNFGTSGTSLNALIADANEIQFYSTSNGGANINRIVLKKAGGIEINTFVAGVVRTYLISGADGLKELLDYSEFYTDRSFISKSYALSLRRYTPISVLPDPILLTSNSVIGTVSMPTSGDFNFDFTDAVLGTEIIVFHQQATIPLVVTGYIDVLYIEGFTDQDYVINRLNVIEFKVVGVNKIKAKVYQLTLGEVYYKDIRFKEKIRIQALAGEGLTIGTGTFNAANQRLKNAMRIPSNALNSAIGRHIGAGGGAVFNPSTYGSFIYNSKFDVMALGGIAGNSYCYADGFCNTQSGDPLTDGLCMQLVYSDTANAGRFALKINAVLHDTGIAPVAGNTYEFQLQYDANADVVRAYINGVPVYSATSAVLPNGLLSCRILVRNIAYSTTINPIDSADRILIYL